MDDRPDAIKTLTLFSDCGCDCGVASDDFVTGANQGRTDESKLGYARGDLFDLPGACTCGDF